MTKEDLRIVYMGTPDFAVESLRRLVEGGYNVVGVITMPDKPMGRHQDQLSQSAVKKYAVEHGLRLLQPVKLKDPDFIEELRSLKADLQIVVAFRMLPEIVWAMPRLGTFNLHASLLPQYRGAAPINWAVINGETETGVTTFFLDKDIDTGRIIKRKYFPIPDRANVEYVYDGLMRLGAELAIETIDLLCEKVADDFDADKILSVMNEITEAQDESSDLRHAPKIFKETCQINWAQEAHHVHNFVRGLSPYPGSWTTLYAIDGEKTEGSVLKIFKTVLSNKSVNAEKVGTIRVENRHLYVATANNWIEIAELQLAGKKRMTACDFLNGNKNIENCCVK